ncbi:MAG: polyprenyl synthetase family protein [Bacteroidetes bacterium]|nr:polyprenyl synthetase family protein [Bacteroidota bacterium]
MPLNTYLEAINNELEGYSYGENPPELYAPIKYLMSIGGKRLRPALTLMAANMWLYKWQKALKPALAVEVFHNFTLMHDDIMDNAPARRGKPTVHEKWDVNTAILSGDVMLVAAYKLLENVEDSVFKKVFSRFNQTASEVCEGQMMDMDFAIRKNVSKEEYIEMIRLKTSVLLGYALELGGLIAEADEESVKLLYSIGENMGIGFQLKDDILDVYADPKKFGKQVGGDIIENKKTWLLLHALEVSENLSEGARLREWLKKTSFDPMEKVSDVREIFNSLEIKPAAEALSVHYFDIAFAALDKLNVSEEKKQPLKAFGLQLLNREN